MTEANFLAQGTLYPDVIESAGTKASKVIKSHHNVGGLPADMRLLLIEPVRLLFKDEVRRVGESLGLPHDFVWRHPFPGPGLAVRILGEVSRESVEILQEADHIVLSGRYKFVDNGSNQRAFDYEQHVGGMYLEYKFP